MERGHLQTEPFTDLIRSLVAEGTCGQHLKEEGKTVAGIGNDAVRKDRMRVPASRADHPQHANLCHSRDAADEVDDPTGIVGMNPASPFRLTAWTGLLLRSEGGHVILEHLL